MKLVIFLFVLIGGVLGLAQASSENGFVMAVDDEENDIVDTTPVWANAKVEDGNLRDLSSGSCRTCNKKYVGITDGFCPPEYQNPAMHRNFKTTKGCQYACCTNIKNDPKCCTKTCDFQCNGEYVVNGHCAKGFEPVRKRWGSFEIGPHGPTGYRKTKTKQFFFKKARCYHGCCSNDLAGTDCCVKHH